ncbi:sensor domain-containing diguanylate cyclase [Leucothrix sargassi]|nr:sensor domain-containing diguanylate cyclase [Leucothrix sargassi]
MSSQTLLHPVSHHDTHINAVKVSADQFEAILNIQQNILDSFAQDKSEADILNQLCSLSESLLKNSVASVMLLDNKTKTLKLISAPSLPLEYYDCLSGIMPGEHNGSCAAAVHYKHPSYVIDTQVDPRWSDNRQLASDLNIRACWSMPVHNRDGKVIGTFALSSFENRNPTTFHDRLLRICASTVSVMLERKELRKLAMLDKLTKLWNRTKLDTVLEAQREAMSEPDYHYAVMLIDIDLFKAVNDNYGHNIGDKVIAKIATLLKKNAPDSAIVGRWGGEEFMVILTKPESLNAADIAQTLRQAVEDHVFETVKTVTVSIGVSVVAKKARTLEIIDDADQALYQAKKMGRNRVSVHYKNKPKKPAIIKILETAVKV